ISLLLSSLSHTLSLSLSLSPLSLIPNLPSLSLTLSLPLSHPL
ncbi:uncharacterized protein LOC131859851, partial [Cryptomeria japonica]